VNDPLYNGPVFIHRFLVLTLQKQTLAQMQCGDWPMMVEVINALGCWPAVAVAGGGHRHLEH
jgi:hypothetical protein